MPRVAIVAVPALLGGALVACAVNPVTGERELALISEEQEIAMGRDGAEQVSSSLGLVEDESVQQYVERIGLELAETSDRPDLPWQFGVVDDAVPNAFALPGGFIYVTRGMLALMDSEAELAAVLGHEIAHVTARHSVNQMSRAQLAQLGLGLGMILEPELQQFGDLANTGLSLLFLKYGRDDERQADELGFGYMREHGYDVREMADVFAALQSSSELAGGSAVPAWLASHPSPPERIAAVRERVDALDSASLGGTVDAERFMSALDGMTYGPDPRNGYFENGMFYHPELAFELAVPESWEKQNLASAVMAASPERDAVMQLRLAQGTPTEAARAFFGGEGVAELDSERARVNDRDAIVSRFEAQLQGGTARGFVAHIAHGGTTYRVLAYSPAGAFSARADTLRTLVTSFGPVSGEALEVEPMRLEVVEIDTDMTLEEFERRYPSAIPLEELAVINQVEGGSSVLEAGTRVKRVT